MRRPASRVRDAVPPVLRRLTRRHPETSPAVSVDPAAPRSGCSAPGLEEHLYSFERAGRPPLILLTATDKCGHLARAIAYDSEDYR